MALSNIKEWTEDILFQELNPRNGGVLVHILASMVSKPLGYSRNPFCLKLCMSSYLGSVKTTQRRVLDYVYDVRLLSDLHIGDNEFCMLGVKKYLSVSTHSKTSPASHPNGGPVKLCERQGKLVITNQRAHRMSDTIEDGKSYHSLFIRNTSKDYIYTQSSFQ